MLLTWSRRSVLPPDASSRPVWSRQNIAVSKHTHVCKTYSHICCSQLIHNFNTYKTIYFSLYVTSERCIVFCVQYELKRCSNKECCKQCRYVMFKGTMTKWPMFKGTMTKINLVNAFACPNRVAKIGLY